MTRRYDQARGSAAQRGYDAQWVRYRRMFLAEHPLCAECTQRGERVRATDVDHIVPVSGPGDPLFWEPTNHQGLCHSDHSRKTAREDGGFGNRAGGSDVQGCDADGMPTAKGHPWNNCH